MIALSIIAAGIIAIAVALFLRPSFELRTADQRGITLQTLIVTAVLVLMAGAAGVVIIAITNNAQDNLEGQNPGVDSRCDPWEIFDPTLSAAGRGGGQGGIESSSIGCVRVCYVRFNTITGFTSYTATATKKLTTKGAAGQTSTDYVDLTDDKLIFSRSDKYEALPATGVKTGVTLPVNGERSVDTKFLTDSTDSDTRVTATIEEIDGETNVNNFEIRVANNQRYCEVWNNTTDQQQLRSKN